MRALMEWIPSPLATVAVWALVGTFAWAAAAKFIGGNEWPKAVAGFGFSGVFARAVAIAVPLFELVIVALFVAGAVRPAAALTLALIAAFSAAIVRVRGSKNENRVPCGCFGGSRDYDYRLLLARNAGLALLGAIVLVAKGDVSLAPPTGAELVPTGLVVVAGVLLTWMAVQTASSLRRR